MMGILINVKEAQEMEYLLKRELEELLLDFEDNRIDPVVKRAMEEKYRIVLGIYRRFASSAECSRYIKSF
ncbi:hypothetical protein [Alteribacillus bidgolensis]|uniref:Uncharacterized protein n=1 Tax=Alteribacillus bidgolensis TaxID=930129 RepID=A0A1G8PAC2_9BACI|nr:hypothetical protein [Alteribacillus bidgolensis]SDI89258.1 hypothetical protein SAMN05216352_1142 [Alteribacillus bidgolensis]